MMTPFLTEAKNQFEAYVKDYLQERGQDSLDIRKLSESMEYSLLNGGKRFRPLLCCAVADALELPLKKVLPLAAAIEFIHTYSLIHDDLPCMDDDSERRGQPTNHIKFGEDMALLAGDSLLTEAFYLLAKEYSEESAPLVAAVSLAAGWSGMIRGQVLDLGYGTPLEKIENLIHLHEQKTGQLIALCFKGAALIAQKDPQEFYELGLKLGLAFQIKDDLLDADEDGEASFTSFMGVAKTQAYLENLTQEIQALKEKLELQSDPINSLIDFNLNRSL